MNTKWKTMALTAIAGTFVGGLFLFYKYSTKEDDDANKARAALNKTQPSGSPTPHVVQTEPNVFIAYTEENYCTLKNLNITHQIIEKETFGANHFRVGDYPEDTADAQQKMKSLKWRVESQIKGYAGYCYRYGTQYLSVFKLLIDLEIIRQTEIKGLSISHNAHTLRRKGKKLVFGIVEEDTDIAPDFVAICDPTALNPYHSLITNRYPCTVEAITKRVNTELFMLDYDGMHPNNSWKVYILCKPHKGKIKNGNGSVYKLEIRQNDTYLSFDEAKKIVSSANGMKENLIMESKTDLFEFYENAIREPLDAFDLPDTDHPICQILLDDIVEKLENKQIILSHKLLSKLYDICTDFMINKISTDTAEFIISYFEKTNLDNKVQNEMEYETILSSMGQTSDFDLNNYLTICIDKKR